ncbi:MAG: hypothetical protein D6820_17870 [Lentisphaerae bacterium]|nr:MAG: hypothetical protein D6820_17870 [Lentisphaerota bacterium]
MGAYNKLNGVHCCENPFLLQKILREEWGFRGFVLSDWSGTHSTVATAMAGLNLEMPRERWYGKKLLTAVREGKVPEKVVDRLVSDILRMLFKFGAFEEKPVYDESALLRPEAVALARQAAAEGIVLLKNEGKLLPLEMAKLDKLAVIGPNGEYGPHFNAGRYDATLIQGGGSAHLAVPREQVVTILQGIQRKVGKPVEVRYAPGAYAETGCGIIPSRYLRTPDGKEQGAELSYYLNTNRKGKPVRNRMVKQISGRWGTRLDIPEANQDPGKGQRFSCEWNAVLQVPATREYTFEIRSASGVSKFYLDGKLLIEHRGNNVDWVSQAKVHLKAETSHRIQVTYAKHGRRGEIQLGWDYENDGWLREAVELARWADAVILTVGFSGNMEREGRDRNSLLLSEAQENLIRTVAAANPRTVVTLTAGSATDMRHWIDRVRAVLFTGYCGQEGGHAVADILFGDVNPSGHLPITFPLSINQYPANYYSMTKEIAYDEGIFVGYRYFDRHQLKPLYPFGYGLSYSRFSYDDLRISKSGASAEKLQVRVRLKVSNSGPFDGATVVQVYVQDMETSEERPPRELKAFKKVWLRKGESAFVGLNLTSRAFQFWSSRRRRWVLEPGRFQIMVGPHSRELPLRGMIELP